MRSIPSTRHVGHSATAAARPGPGESGATIVEFALLAPVFLALLGAIMEFSGIMFAQTLLEGAAREASRYGITGQAPEGTDHMNREDKIREIMQETGVGVIDIDQLQMEPKVYEAFEDVGEPEPYSDDNDNGSYDAGEPYQDINGNGQWDDDMGAAGLGGPGDIVVYRLEYDWPIMIPLFEPFFGETVTLRANIAVRNEPYPGTPPGGSGS